MVLVNRPLDGAIISGCEKPLADEELLIAERGELLLADIPSLGESVWGWIMAITRGKVI